MYVGCLPRAVPGFCSFSHSASGKAFMFGLEGPLLSVSGPVGETRVHPNLAKARQGCIQDVFGA